MKRAKKADYKAVIQDINRVGVGALRAYIKKHHPLAAPNFERNILIIKYAYNNGATEAGRLYGVFPSTVGDIITNYWRYAREILEERQ